jgi:FeS assembly SUF system protein
MSSQPSNDPPRIIPLADAPVPDPPLPPVAAAAADSASVAFQTNPLNSLKFRPLIIEQLSKVFDPEIPVNIYELGLVYDIDVDDEGNAHVRMTLTAPGCPAAQTIPLDVERRIREIPGINDVKVEIVWDPPWTKERMSDVAKLTLGML